MKKCPKCSKSYDDSWGVCLDCSAQLVQAEGAYSLEQIKKEQKLCEKSRIQQLNIDVKRLEGTRQRMKRDIKYFIGSWGLLFLMLLISSIAGNNSILNGIAGFLLIAWLSGFIFFRLSIIFGIRRIYVDMKDKPSGLTSNISLLQLMAFFFPFGELLFSSEALKDSKKILALLTS